MNGSDPARRTRAPEDRRETPRRRAFVTRHQVSGWRFVVRRLAAGLALHDTRMLVEPLRAQSRAVLVGVLVVVTGVAGCLVFSLLRPAGVVGEHSILVDRDSAALYVRLGDTVHPVLNLASARLIVDRPEEPASVIGRELDRFARGNLVGIPGAPERMVQSASRDAQWTVCDAVAGPRGGITVIAGPLATGGGRAAPLADTGAVLVRNAAEPVAGTWLLWGGRRSRVDPGDRAVTDALFEGRRPAPRPIAPGLFNAIPEAPALRVPTVTDAGEPPRYPVALNAPVGSVVDAFDEDQHLRHYAVLAGGLEPISSMVAAVLRNADSHGFDAPPRLTADTVSRIPLATGIDVSTYPARPPALVPAAAAPVTCAHWSLGENATVPSLELLVGQVLPLADGRQPVPLVGAGMGSTADRTVSAPGIGYLVAAVGESGPVRPAHGPLSWIGDTGVRYPVDTGDDTGDDTDRGAGRVAAAAALGMTGPPLPIPAAMLDQYAAGPMLSHGDAMLAHDGLGPDPHPAALVGPS